MQKKIRWQETRSRNEDHMDWTKSTIMSNFEKFLFGMYSKKEPNIKVQQGDLDHNYSKIYQNPTC